MIANEGNYVDEKSNLRKRCCFYWVSFQSMCYIFTILKQTPENLRFSKINGRPNGSTNERFVNVL